MIEIIKPQFTQDELDVLYRAEHIIKNKMFGQTIQINSPNSVSRYLNIKLAGHQREVFGLLHLDTQRRIIGDQILFYGTIDASAVYPREIVKSVLSMNSQAVILYHNHPSGHTTPSSSDIKLTEKIKKALSLIDVGVLDHIIVGGGNFSSFLESNLINNLENEHA